MKLVNIIGRIKKKIWPWPPKSLNNSLKQVSSPSDFQRIVEIERCRVNRNGGTFALIVFNLEHFQLELKFLSKLVKGIFNRARMSDQMGWYDYNRLGLIMPQTSIGGAKKFIQDLYQQKSNGMPKPQIDLYIYPLQNDSSDKLNQDGKLQETIIF